MALTPKQRRFVDAVLGGASNKDAAIAAGYSEKTASAAGSRLVKHPEVKKVLLKALGEMAEGTTDRRFVDAVASPAASAEGDDYGRPVTDLMKLHRDPRDFLLAVMNDLAEETKLRVDAGKALLPFFHARKGEGGKKDAQKNAAKKAGAGRFASAAPPKLIASGGKIV